jgi:holo-ACP synthase CitX
MSTHYTKVLPQEILSSRERRAERQMNMLTCDKVSCVISFTLNIAGPVKLNPLIRESFAEGSLEIQGKLKQNGIKVLRKEQRVEKTGCEALFSVAYDAIGIKRMMVEIEEEHPLGRLFDIDVISKEGYPVSRAVLGFPKRRCLVCDRIAHECARAGRHHYELLQRKAGCIMQEYLHSRCGTPKKSKQHIGFEG